MRNDIPAPSRRSPLASPRATLGLAEAVNHLLDRGVVLAGDGVVSSGGVALVYLGASLVRWPTETWRRHHGGPPPPPPPPRRRGGASSPTAHRQRGGDSLPLPLGEGGGEGRLPLPASERG